MCLLCLWMVFLVLILPVCFTGLFLGIQRSRFTFPTWILALAMIFNMSVIVYPIFKQMYMYCFCRDKNISLKGRLEDYFLSKEKCYQYSMCTYSMAKQISMYIFSGCFSLHVSFHLYIHTESWMSISMNISILFYLAFLFFRFFLFIEQTTNIGCCDIFLSFLIYFANTFDFFIPLLESTYVSNCDENITSAEQISNHTSNPDIFVLEKIHPFLVPGIVGFTLLTFEYESFVTFQNKIATAELNSQMPTTNKQKMTIYFVHHILFFIVLVLFCLVLTQKLIDDFIMDSSILALICVRFVVKIFESVSFISMVSYFIWKAQLSFCSLKNEVIQVLIKSVCCRDISIYLFFIAFLYHLVHHIILFFYCHNDDTCPISVIDNIVNISVDILQTIFILHVMTYSSNQSNPEDEDIQFNETFLNSVISVCGFLNIGLWISDSIVKDWMNINLFCKNRNERLLGILNVSLYFTMFFHFQTGLAYFKLYWIGVRSFLTQVKNQRN